MSNKRYLVIIPARAGSKGLPGKNTKLLAGKPMIQYTIEAALGVFDKENICITTDDQKVIDIAEGLGINVPFVRPSYLATDSATSQDVISHAIDYYKGEGNTYDAIILLQPTSPLRTAKHIEEAIELYTDEVDMVVSVKETSANPYYVLFEEDENGYLQKSKKGNFTRRQDCPHVWEYNGAIYVMNIKSLKANKINEFEKVVKYEMDDRSSVDIDNKFDFILANELLNG